MHRSVIHTKKLIMKMYFVFQWGPRGAQMGLISKNGGVKISLHCRFN